MVEQRNQRWQGRTAVITGASSGIGAATARRLASEGVRLVLVARREDRLTELARELESKGGQAAVFAADLTQPVDRQALFDTVQAQYGGADILVNNAGFGWYGYYTDMTWPLAEEMLRLNVEAVMALTWLFLPGMRARKRGAVINIGSIAGALPNQGIAMYSGTKAFLDAFTTCLYRELRGSGVQATVIRPGAVKTDFFETARKRPAGRSIPAEGSAVPVESVSEAVWSALLHPRRVVYVPWQARFSPLLEAFFGWAIDWVGPILLKRGSN